MVESFQGLKVTITADAAPLRRELAAAGTLGRDFGRAMTTAFDAVALRGRALSAVVRGLAADLSRAALSTALRPVEQALSRGAGALFGAVAGFAKGGTTGARMPVPFASGGVVASPIAFPLAGGRTGIAGEAGPEAILPLARGADGRLGVRAQGAARPIAITFNVTTPDAASFRRSEAQITAMLSRAVSRGSRNL